jgi:hypothetical protein
MDQPCILLSYAITAKNCEAKRENFWALTFGPSLAVLVLFVSASRVWMDVQCNELAVAAPSFLDRAESSKVCVLCSWYSFVDCNRVPMCVYGSSPNLDQYDFLVAEFDFVCTASA